MIVIRVITICLMSAGPPAPALTVCSWAGLDYTIDNKERTLYFETFLRWVGAFRSLNNLKLRILIGGLFNVDLKVIQVGSISQNMSKYSPLKFWKFPDIAPLLYANRPNPNERRELKCSFIFTKDNLKVLRWNITSQL